MVASVIGFFWVMRQLRDFGSKLGRDWQCSFSRGWPSCPRRWVDQWQFFQGSLDWAGVSVADPIVGLLITVAIARIVIESARQFSPAC